MKIKNKTKFQMMYAAVALLLFGIIYLWNNPRRVVEEVEVEVPVAVPVEVRPKRTPEYRDAPIKQYKPGHTQQMGLLIGPNSETLPLYGKETRTHRDRYHYYTTTNNGNQIYPLPITMQDGRECTDDIGCSELYGQERVSVTGQDGEFEVKMYRTDNFF